MRTRSAGGAPPLRWALGSQSAGQLVTITSGMATIALLTRVLSTADYGRFMAVWSLVVVCSALVRAGAGRALLREIPARLGAGDVHAADRMAAAGLQLVLGAAVVLFPALVAVTALVVPGVSWWSGAALLTGAVTAFEAARLVGESTMLAFGRSAQSQLLGSPLRGVLYLLVSVLVLGLEVPWSFERAIAALLVVNSAVTLLQIVSSAHVAPATLRISPRAGAVRGLVRAAPAFLVLDVAAIVLVQGDIVVAGRALDPTAVGTYAVASRLGSLFALPSAVIGAAITPRLARLAGAGQVEKAVGLAHRAAWLSLGATASATAGFAVLGRPLLHVLFGAGFESSHALTLVFAGGAVLSSYAAFAGVLLIVCHQERVVVAVMVTAALGVLALGYPAGRVLGPAGLASVSALATGAQAWVLELVRRRRRGS